GMQLDSSGDHDVAGATADLAASPPDLASATASCSPSTCSATFCAAAAYPCPTPSVTNPSSPERAVLIFSELAPARAPTAIPAVKQTNSLRVSGITLLPVTLPNAAPSIS